MKITEKIIKEYKTTEYESCYKVEWEYYNRYCDLIRYTIEEELSDETKAFIYLFNKYDGVSRDTYLHILETVESGVEYALLGRYLTHEGGKYAPELDNYGEYLRCRHKYVKKLENYGGHTKEIEFELEDDKIEISNFEPKYILTYLDEEGNTILELPANNLLEEQGYNEESINENFLTILDSDKNDRDWFLSNYIVYENIEDYLKIRNMESINPKKILVTKL